LAESGFERREQAKRSQIGGRIRAISGKGSRWTVADTLFFAGEAVGVKGKPGNVASVHGAIESGIQAARDMRLRRSGIESANSSYHGRRHGE
jgi:hypothetical protein